MMNIDTYSKLQHLLPDKKREGITEFFNRWAETDNNGLLSLIVHLYQTQDLLKPPP